MKWRVTVKRDGVEEYENSGEGRLELWKVFRDILRNNADGCVSVEIDVHEEG